MQILEATFTIGNSGSFKIPATVLKKMNLFPGDHVRVAYLTKDGQQNTFHEFFLSSDSMDGISEDCKFSVPSDLLEKAKIPENADLQIFCLNGCLLICQDTAFNLTDLRSILENLQTAEDIAYSLPIDPALIKERIQELADYFEEGSSENDGT